jgi:hypothetical protein
MKVTLSEKRDQLTIVGDFNLDGVPTLAARGDAGNDGLNHGSTGFPQATGTTFKAADGKMRQLYVGVNVTSHLVGGKNGVKPKF